MRTPAVAPLPGYLAERFAAWRESRFADARAWYARLAAKGQSPRTMVISCCDSRVDTVQMFGAEPGDLFVVRNVANLVPPYTPDHRHHGTSAAVEYAVGTLGVAHIVVVGHSGCGGVAACDAMCSGAEPGFDSGSSFIGRWMEILRPGFERVADIAEPEKRLTALERESVVTSLINLEGFPFVQAAREAGVLTLHGGWIDIATGRLYVLGRDGAWRALQEGAIES